MSESSSSERNPVEELADEFLERFRRGERPALSEYTNRYPEWADKIRSLFPLLIDMEAARPAPQEGPSPEGGVLVSADQKLEQLGDYRVLREVGRGGMGIVYEAVQVSLGRHVALKVLPRHALLEPRHLQRFEREAKAAARLHHTNIVPVYGVGEENGLHYYVMQFIQGHGFDEVLTELRRLRRLKEPPGSDGEAPDTPAKAVKEMSAAEVAQSLLSGRFSAGPASEGRQPPDESVHQEADAPRSPDPDPSSSDTGIHLPGQSAQSTLSETGRPYWQGVARVGVQVAEAVAYASSQGILHRDIKPSNLLLDAQGTVWVTDFGLAKAADSEDLTHTGDVVGTLRYMPPERFRGESDPRGDVYSLGITLYELVTLRPAFTDSDRARLMERVTHEDPPRPRKLDRQIPRDLETILLKAIDKDAAHRYLTAGALAEDLQRFLADRPVSARPVGSLERLLKWAKRKPAAAGLLVISLVAALASVGTGVALVFNARLQAANAQLAYYQYLHHIARAQAEWHDGNLGRAREHLDQCRSDQRGWEWACLKRLCHGELLTLTGDSRQAFLNTLTNSVAFSPDGTRLAWVRDNDVGIWDFGTGRELLPLRGHLDRVNGVAFSPDGRRLASAGADGLKIWDMIAGREERTVSDRAFDCLAFSPDGRRLVGSDAKSLMVYDITTCQCLVTIDRDSYLGRLSVAFSPDGTQVAGASEGGFGKVWDANTGRELYRPNAGRELSARNVIEAVMFSPDGTRLALGGWGQTVWVWDTTTHSEVMSLPIPREISSLAFSPDGRLLVTGGEDGTVWVWDLATRRETRVIRAHTYKVYCVAFSPDGTRIVTMSQDGTVKVWDATTGQDPLTFTGSADWVTSVAFSPDRKLLASAGDPSGTVNVWDTTTNQLRYFLRGHSARVWSVAFSPDGMLLASASEDHTVRLWDSTTGQLLSTFRHASAVSSVAFSPDGQRIASATGLWYQKKLPGEVKIWDVGSRQVVQTLSGHDVGIATLAFSPDGTRIASASYDQTVRVWDTNKGQEPLFTCAGHTNWVIGVCFSPDGKRIASGSWDTTVRMWDGWTGKELDILRGHTNVVNQVAFTPDGTRLASASGDKTVRIWDVKTGQETLTLRGYTNYVSPLALSSDGTRLATGSGDGMLRIWDTRPWAEDAVAEREALGLLNFLFSKPLAKADVFDHLRTSPTMTTNARQLALSLVDRYREETDPEKYHQASWAIVRQPYLNAFQYRFALSQAVTACRLAPQQRSYVSTLGIAQYRLGKYREVVETLTRSDKSHAGIVPADLAFLAMAYHRLGETEKAKDYLNTLQETMRQPQWAKNEEAQAFLREAEALMNLNRRA